jgi:hypothetical protein
MVVSVEFPGPHLQAQQTVVFLGPRRLLDRLGHQEKNIENGDLIKISFKKPAKIEKKLKLNYFLLNQTHPPGIFS